MSEFNNIFSLTGKVAVVTGAGGRGNSIGRAYALALANAGAAIVVADLNIDGARCVAEDVKTAGGRAMAACVDISDRPSVDQMVQATIEHFGGIDILVNNAALMAELDYRPVIEIGLEEWTRILAVNLTGALNCVQAMVTTMRSRGGGKIVNQLSAGAFPPESAYGISKIALLGLTTTLARELGPSGINVNAIAPGITMSDAGKALTPPDSEFVKMVEARAMLRARGTPEDLVGALLFLCSSASDWVSGQIMHIDGGFIVRP